MNNVTPHDKPLRGRVWLAATAVLVLVLGQSSTALGQVPGDPLTQAAKRQFDYIHALVMRAAEKVDGEMYSFRATPEVRSLGGILGHIADANVLLCTAAAGGRPQILRVHEKKTSKAEIIEALKTSKAFCDEVIGKMSDAVAPELVEAFDPSHKTPKLSWIHATTSHAWEHYGNVVTYMRLKNIVPPSSETK